MNRYLQATVSIAAACAAVASLRITESALRDHIEIAAVSYLTLAWTTAIGANVVYWSITMAELPLRLTQRRRLELVWHDPAHTPGVIRICTAYSFTALALFLGVVATEVLTLLVPNKNESSLLDGLSLLFPVFAFVLALYVAAQPLYTLQYLVRRHKHKTLHSLQASLRKQSEDADRLLGVYNAVQASPDLPMNTANTVEYAAALGAVFVAFLIQRYLG
jgi:hypothetical protein